MALEDSKASQCEIIEKDTVLEGGLDDFCNQLSNWQGSLRRSKIRDKGNIRNLTNLLCSLIRQETTIFLSFIRRGNSGCHHQRLNVYKM